MVQYCVLYLFCCNVRPVSPRIRSSVLTAYLRQNADGACLIITRTRRRALFVSDSLSRQYPSLLTRTPARAHSQAEKHHFALSPPRGQGSGRQIYAAEKRPHTVEYDYGGVDRTVPPDLCRRVRHGDLLIFLFFGRQTAYFSACFSLTQRAARGISAENTRPATSVQKRSGAAIPYFIPDTTTYTPNTTQTMPQKNSGRSQPPSGKGLSEYLLQSAKGAGSRTLFPCKLPTRRKITPRPLPCYNTDTEGRRTYKTFDRKTAAPVFRTDEP